MRNDGAVSPDKCKHSHIESSGTVWCNGCDTWAGNLETMIEELIRREVIVATKLDDESWQLRLGDEMLTCPRCGERYEPEGEDDEHPAAECRDALAAELALTKTVSANAASEVNAYRQKLNRLQDALDTQGAEIRRLESLVE